MVSNTPRAVLFLLAASLAATAQPRAGFLHKHLADYDAEPRLTNGRVDTDALTQRLSNLGATAYYWLVWHARTDWDDLQLFLPKAAKAHLQVWVYVLPPTEGPPNGYPASEPFGLDYPRWAKEIARLSLQHTNLTGWVIDDFYANNQLFTPACLSDLQARTRRINPRLAFLPLMYFPEITPQFVAAYHKIIDGVVVAYPKDLEEITNARAILNGEIRIVPRQLSCPWGTPTQPGDFASATTSGRVSSSDHVKLRFLEEDDFTGPTAGYHFKQLLADGEVVWEDDAAAGTSDWREITVDLTPKLHGKTNVTLAFRLYDKKGVSNFGVRWRLKDLRAEGLKLAAALDEPQSWRVDQRGPFEAGFGAALQKTVQADSIHVPFIVMTAGSPEEFRLRHGEPGSPERIAGWLRMCLQSWRDGQCDGVVTYCLDKQPQSRLFPLASSLYREFKAE